jgi:hypothetical protein
MPIGTNNGAGRHTTLFTRTGGDQLLGSVLPMRSRSFAIGHDTLGALEALLALPVRPVVPEAEANRVCPVALASE